MKAFLRVSYPGLRLSKGSPIRFKCFVLGIPIFFVKGLFGVSCNPLVKMLNVLIQKAFFHRANRGDVALV